MKCGNSGDFAPFLTPEMDGDNIDMMLDAPPRSMWGQGEGTRGYCGETSFQTHGILFGNWISSEIARLNADGIELLIGENDVKAATAL